MFTASISDPRRLHTSANATANAAQARVAMRETQTPRWPSTAPGEWRPTTSTTVVEASALSSEELEFIEAANTAANTMPISPTGRWASTNERNTQLVSPVGGPGWPGGISVVVCDRTELRVPR